MKNRFIIWLIAFLALIATIALQGMWLYNTYKLLNEEFKKNVSNILIRSLIKEDMLRFNDPVRKETWKEKAVYGVHPDGDPYTNNRALQDWLYKEDYPVSLEKVDSIFNEEIKKSY
ncbi:MAG: hypothetical protein LBI03_01130, partial [Clostridiales bacterium]|nr:hypothetical protein [Clostridiales bacterium]